MRLLVVGDKPTTETLVRTLTADGRDVFAADFEHAELEIRHAVPEVLVVIVPDVDGPDLVRRLCAADRGGTMYVLCVVSERLLPRTIATVVAAGSHDVLCAPYSNEELRTRVDVHRRLRRWLSVKTKVVAHPVPHNALTELRAWEYLGDVISDDLESMMGRPITIEEGWISLTDSIQLATIAMTLPTEGIELCVSIVADNVGRRWLGENLLGDPSSPDEALDDIMRELANVAGGALKRAAAIEGPTLSTGIPVDGNSLPRRESGARCWKVIVEGSVRIAAVGEVRRRANRKIPAKRLVEGMVVVSDIRNSAGVLLLPSGTRLTLTTAHRLSGLLDSMMVEVSV